jgi:hypothetical protein
MELILYIWFSTTGQYHAFINTYAPVVDAIHFLSFFGSGRMMIPLKDRKMHAQDGRVITRPRRRPKSVGPAQGTGGKSLLCKTPCSMIGLLAGVACSASVHDVLCFGFGHEKNINSG